MNADRVKHRLLRQLRMNVSQDKRWYLRYTQLNTTQPCYNLIKADAILFFLAVFTYVFSQKSQNTSFVVAGISNTRKKGENLYVCTYVVLWSWRPKKIIPCKTEKKLSNGPRVDKHEDFTHCLSFVSDTPWNFYWPPLPPPSSCPRSYCHRASWKKLNFEKNPKTHLLCWVSKYVH